VTHRSTTTYAPLTNQKNKGCWDKIENSWKGDNRSPIKVVCKDDICEVYELK